MNLLTPQLETKAGFKALYNKFKEDNAILRKRLYDVETERDNLLCNYMELQEKGEMLQEKLAELERKLENSVQSRHVASSDPDSSQSDTGIQNQSNLTVDTSNPIPKRKLSASFLQSNSEKPQAQKRPASDSSPKLKKLKTSSSSQTNAQAPKKTGSSSKPKTSTVSISGKAPSSPQIRISDPGSHAPNKPNNLYRYLEGKPYVAKANKVDGDQACGYCVRTGIRCEIQEGAKRAACKECARRKGGCLPPTQDDIAAGRVLVSRPIRGEDFLARFGNPEASPPSRDASPPGPPNPPSNVFVLLDSQEKLTTIESREQTYPTYKTGTTAKNHINSKSAPPKSVAPATTPDVDLDELSALESIYHNDTDSSYSPNVVRRRR